MNSRHPKTPARGLGGSVLRLLTPFPANPRNPRLWAQLAAPSWHIGNSTSPFLSSKVQPSCVLDTQVHCTTNLQKTMCFCILDFQNSFCLDPHPPSGEDMYIIYSGYDLGGKESLRGFWFLLTMWVTSIRYFYALGTLGY